MMPRLNHLYRTLAGNALLIALLLAGTFAPSSSEAACSSWRGKVFLNEYYAAVGGSNVQFLEVFSQDKNFATSTWQGWKIEVKSKSGSTIKTATYNLASSATNYECRINNKAWITRELTGSEDLEKNIGMVILRDGANKPVDVLVFDNTLPPSGPAPWPATNGTGGYYPALQTECNTLGNALNTQRTAAVGASKPYNAFNMVIFQANANKNYARFPDGSGNWYSSDDTGSGSTKTTCSSNNTSLVKWTTTPVVSPGDVATWKVKLTNPDAAISGINITDVFTQNTDVTGTATSPPTLTSVTTSLSPATGCGAVSSYNATTGSLSWTGVGLATGASCELTINALIPSTVPENEIFTNTASTTISGQPLADTAQVLVKRKVAVDLRLDDPTAVSGTQTFQDSSGASRHAQAVGGCAMATNGKVCKGASVPGNTNATIDAINTRYNVSTGLGGYGGVAFWYKNALPWSGTGAIAQMLFDASNGTALFYLVKNSNGSLTFKVSDTTPTTYTATSTTNAIAADTWTHVAAVWQLIDGSKPYLAIYVNGILTGSSTAAAVGTDINATLQTLYVGDSRTGTAPSGGTLNSANGQFDMLRLFTGNIASADITAALNAKNPCLTKVVGAETYNQGTNGNWTVSIADAKETNSSIAVTDSITSSVSGQDLTGVTATPSPSCGTATFSNTGGTWNTGTAMAAGATCTLGITGTVPLSATVGSTYTNTVTAVINNANQSASALFTVTAGVNGFNAIDGHSSQTDYGNGRIYTKVAGQAFSVKIGAVSAGSLLGSFAGTVKAELVANNTPGSGYGSDNCPNPSESTVLSPTANVNLASGVGTWSGINVSQAYKDVRVRISFPATGTPTTVTCSNDSFAIRPAQFNLSLGTTTPIIAGDNFTITAVSSHDGYSGTPEITTSAITPHTGYVQAGTLTGTLGAYTSGESTGTFNYNEVGTFQLNQNAVFDDAYTGIDQTADCVIDSGTPANSFSNTINGGGKYGCYIGTGTNPSFGAFIPSHFETVLTGSMACNITQFTTACPAGGLVYAGQTFGTKVTAYIKGGTGVTGIAKNYDGTTARNVALTAWDAAGSTTLQNPQNAADGTSVATGDGVLANASILASKFMEGVADVVASDTTAQKYSFGTNPSAPTDIYMRAIDTDNVSSLIASGTSLEGGLRVVSGRVKLANAFGSELLPITVTATAYYWDPDKGWAINSSDSGTTPGAATQTSPTGSMTTTASTATYPSPNQFSGGLYPIQMSAPAPKTGSVTLTLDVPDYLQINGSDPTAKVIFGIYNPRPAGAKTIYRREVR